MNIQSHIRQRNVYILQLSNDIYRIIIILQNNDTRFLGIKFKSMDIFLWITKFRICSDHCISINVDNL